MQQAQQHLDQKQQQSSSVLSSARPCLSVVVVLLMLLSVLLPMSVTVAINCSSVTDATVTDIG
jgi:hypothetical protein